MSNANVNSKVGTMVRMAVLVAILLVLDATGLGMIKTPGLEFTIMQVPVIIGAILMGPAAGAALGGVFGLISFWECFGRSAFGAVLLGVNPIGTFITCVPTRILMGLCCGLIFKALYNRKKTKMISFGAASLAGALLNTAFFMSVLMAFFFHTEFIQNMAGGLSVLPFIVAFVGIQGLLEAIICAVVGTVVAAALYRALGISKQKAVSA